MLPRSLPQGGRLRQGCASACHLPPSLPRCCPLTGFAATNLWHKSLRTYPAAVAFNWAEEFFAQHPFYGALSVLHALCEPSLQGRSPSP